MGKKRILAAAAAALGVVALPVVAMPGRSAYGAGQYWLGRGDGYRADIALTDVKQHGSQRYFEDAAIIAAKHRTVHLWYGSDHGVVGWWQS